MTQVESLERTAAGWWKMREYDTDNPLDMIRRVARYRYAWPGGYELAIITSDGGLICNDCVRENYAMMLDSTKKKISDGWKAEAITSEAEWDGEQHCDHCNRVINPIEADYVLCMDCMLYMETGDLTFLDYYYCEKEEEANKRQAEITEGAADLPNIAKVDQASFSKESCNCCGNKLGGEKFYYQEIK